MSVVDVDIPALNKASKIRGINVVAIDWHSASHAVVQHVRVVIRRSHTITGELNRVS